MSGATGETKGKRGRKRTLQPEDLAAQLQERREKRKKQSHRSHRSISGVTLTLGEGDVGQLGLGEEILERTKPAKIDIAEAVVQICAGGMHTACLTEKGEVYTFGCNDEGTLGRDTSEEGSETRPAKVNIPANIVQISAGDSHTAALSDDGRVYVWGTFRDANGTIGLTLSKKIVTSPITILEDQIVAKIASGADHLVILTQEGFIYTLGNGDQGQLGRVAECFSMRGGRKGLALLLIPAIVHCKKKSTRFSDIWAGSYATYAQEEKTKEIYAWGLNNYYQLGIADMKNKFVPALCKSYKVEPSWREISIGQHHAIALSDSGKVYVVGRKEYGRLGLGEDCEETKEPQLVPGLEGIRCTGVSAGSAVSLAVSEDGTIYAWGMGSSKQLGQREEDDLWVPTVLTGKQLETRSGVMVSAGGQHTVLLAKETQ